MTVVFSNRRMPDVPITGEETVAMRQMVAVSLLASLASLGLERVESHSFAFRGFERDVPVTGAFEVDEFRLTRVASPEN